MGVRFEATLAVAAIWRVHALIMNEEGILIRPLRLTVSTGRCLQQNAKTRMSGANVFLKIQVLVQRSNLRTSKIQAGRSPLVDREDYGIPSNEGAGLPEADIFRSRPCRR